MSTIAKVKFWFGKEEKIFKDDLVVEYKDQFAYISKPDKITPKIQIEIEEINPNIDIYPLTEKELIDAIKDDLNYKLHNTRLMLIDVANKRGYEFSPFRYNVKVIEP